MKSFKTYIAEKVIFQGQDDYYVEAAKFFLEKYGVNPDKVSLLIQLKSGLKEQNGLTAPSQKMKNGYVVFLNDKLAGANMLRTLAHEMYHVAQMESGDLKMDFKKGEVHYKGDKMDLDMPYRKRPFEVDAYANEKKHIQDFIKKFGNNVK